MRILFACLSLLILPGTHAGTTIAPDDAHAWSANSGWINLRADDANGVVAGSRFLSGHAWSGNVGWIHFGDGTPANGHAYAGNSASDFGVNHDGAGNLSGHAYSANTGWINFGWAATTNPQRPRIDLLTGDFAGYAYGANTGWINLGTGHLRTTILSYHDSDGDGIADAWEMQWFGNLSTATITSDQDHDGVSDVAEFIADTRPLDPNSTLKIIAHDYNAALTQATLQFGHTVPTRLYRIEHSVDLQSPWSAFSPSPFAPDAGSFTTRIVTFPGSTRRFFRVVPLLPLHP